MAKIKVSWGNYSFNGKAESVYEEIKSIGSEVKPRQIVDYAEANPESELHKCFTWDNDIAADKYRLFEARQIVCNLKVTYTKDEDPKETKTIRAMYRTDTHRDAGYKPTFNIIKNDNEYKGLLAVAVHELKMFERKYSMLSELNEVFEAINNL